MTVRYSQSSSDLQSECCEYLEKALSSLNANIEESDCLKLAQLVLPCMAGQWRFFHTFPHVLAVGGDTDAIEMLAGAFHDLVYVQVDRGIPFNLTHFLSPVVEEVNGSMVLRSPRLSEQRLPWLLDLFNLKTGQTLSPFAGQNEFLSALVAIKVLEPFLEVRDQLAIALCIEATIPFRKLEATDGLAEHRLATVRQICEHHHIAVSEEELITMVRRSVRLANRDVMSFAQNEAAHFLADTWNLLPESNHQFFANGLPRIQDYRSAIEKTEQFFMGLDPDSIYQQFRGEPSTTIYSQWHCQASLNLQVGRLYLSCKLIAIALLEAMAVPFGQDTSLQLFMGTLPNSNETFKLRLEEFFPPAIWQGETLSPIQSEVWQLLSQGRAASRHQQDLLSSPVAAFLLQFHGFEPLPQQRQAAKGWLAGTLPYEQFLQHFDPQFLNLFYEAISRMWEQRQLMFDAYFRPQSEMPVQVESGGLESNLATRLL